MKPILLHAHGKSHPQTLPVSHRLKIQAGPNPWKVALILEELKIPYEIKVWATADQKKPPFTTTLNPNGFTPVIEDPNTSITIWESGAIIDYILETYDTTHQLSFPAATAAKDRALAKQYHYFQATFQGPNLSNALFFTRAKPNPAARERFIAESLRVLGVLEGALAGKHWLVGGRCSAADLVFLPYFWSLPFVMGEAEPDMDVHFPGVHAWVARMGERASVKKVAAERAAAFAAATAAAAAK